VSPRNVLRNHLGFRLAVSAVLATTVGLNVAVFALVSALWLRPIPVKDPQRLVTIVGASHNGFTSKYFATFETVAGQVATDLGLEPEVRLPGIDRVLETVGVTSGYFALLGLEIRGRDFAEDDDRIGAEMVAIISHRFWSQAFDGRDAVIGTVVTAHPVPLRILGVAPAGFDGARRGERTDVWIPRAVFNRVLRLPTERAMPSFTFLARLLPGDSVANADRRVKEALSPTVSVASISEIYGTPAQATVVIGEGRAARVVAGLSLLGLVGGCAAIAALVLVHYERRRREFAVRAALGASRARLVRSLAGELAAMGLIGTIGSVTIATVALRLLPSLSLSLPGGVDLGRLDVSLDWRVLLAGISMTTTTLVLAASLPIARFTQKTLAGEVLQGPAITTSVASQRVRQALVGLLVCATVVVLLAAGLFIRAVDQGFGHGAGFDVKQTLFAKVPLTPPGPGTVRSREFIDARARLVQDALRTIPGVDSVAIGSSPIDSNLAVQARTPTPLTVNGIVRPGRVGYFSGSPELLSTLGVPIVAGRELTAGDLGVVPIPTVVTESVARKLWPTGSPLGQPLGSRYIVVGIARDFAFGTLTDPAEGVRVVPQHQNFGATPKFAIRTQRPDVALIQEIRRVLRDLLPDAPAPTILTGAEIIAADVGQQRLGAWFFSGFGLVALVVGVGSVFGLVAYVAESRRREFAVRLALGATARDLVRLGVSVALTPAAVGLVSGMILAAVASRVFASVLIGVSSVDWLTYSTVAAVMLSATASAALIAAWRLRRVTPAEALRVC
jgi:putative ABC transport system permease protein